MTWVNLINRPTDFDQQQFEVLSSWQDDSQEGFFSMYVSRDEERIIKRFQPYFRGTELWWIWVHVEPHVAGS